MRNFFVISVPEPGLEPVLRTFQADSIEHTEEQFSDAIPDETISWILDSADSKNFLSTQETGISEDGAFALCKAFCKLQVSSMPSKELVAWSADLAVETYKFPGTEAVLVTSLLEDIGAHWGGDFEDDLREFLGKHLTGSDLEAALQLLEL